MILIKQEDGSYTESGDNTFTSNLMDGLKAPFLKENEFLSSGAAFWSAIEYGALGTAGGSMIARSRQAKGQPPMLKVFF